MTGRNEPAASSGAPLLVVGVGASAGGLEAVETFLGALTPGLGLALVIVFHLDPMARSLLPELLEKHTPLPVIEARDGMMLEADRVYTAPGHSIVTVERGAFRFVPMEAVKERRTPIDRTLESLADELRGRAAAVILSGLGSDGTFGLKAVSDAGGVTFVQEPSTARHDAMPQSAIASGAADHVLPPEALAVELVAYARHVQAMPLPLSDRDLRLEIESVLPAICEVLLEASGHNFRHYKTSTLVRRVLRRMQVLRLASPADYLDRLRANRSEAQQLFNDLLIGVTAFFRDPDAFAVLARDVLPRVFDQRQADQPVRIWCVGCATGEEAYSLAMLVREQLERMTGPAPEVQLFATDIDEESLAFARKGVYPAGIANEVGPERLARFFVKKGPHYHVARDVRELVLFSAHNVINDPPFSRLDLITCRNVLIYLGEHLQKKLIPLFHYALRPGGYLFLGPSENLSSHRELFRPVDARHRLSQRMPTAIRTPGLLTGRNGPITSSRHSSAPPPTEHDIYQLMQRITLDEFAPKTVVVNEDGQIVCLSGNLEKYLTLAAGAFQNSLTRLAQEGLRVGVRAALAECARTRRKVVNDGLSVRTADGVQRVMVTAQPMPQMGEDTGLFLIVFQDVGLPVASDDPQRTSPGEDAAALVELLERELSTTRSDLERTVQELEAANEELKSGNEELLSMNEELQSANEELEASKEELQAANESLTRVNNDLENLLTSTQIATLFLDREAHLRRVTSAAARVFSVQPGDAGRPLSDFTHRARHMPPMPAFEDVRDAEKPLEDEVEMRDGSVLLRRVLPYRTREGAPEGVVVTFTDVTERVHAERALKESEARFRMLAESIPQLVWMTDASGEITWYNQRWYEYTGTTPERMRDEGWRWLHDPEVLPRVVERWSASLATGEPFDMTMPLRRADGRFRPFLTRVLPLRDGAGRIRHWFGTSTDVSEQVAAEGLLRQVIDGMFAFVGVLDDRGTLLEANDAPIAIAGVNRADVIGRPFWECFWWSYDPAVQDRVRAAFARAMQGEAVRYDDTIRTAGDGRMVIDFMLKPVLEGGRVVRVIPSGVDVTARRAAEERYREGEALLAAVLDSLPTAVVIADREGRIVRTNKALAAIWGAERRSANVDGYDDYIGYWPDTGRRVEAREWPLARAVLHGETSTSVRVDITRLDDGNTRHIELSAAPVVGAQGERLGGVVITVDVTDRVRAENAVREHAEELDTIMRSVPLALWIAHDPACQRITGNPESYRLLRMTEGVNTSASSGAEAARRPFAEHRDGRPLAPDELPMQVAGRTGRAVAAQEISFVFADGEVRHTYGNATPLRDREGRVRGVVAAFVDITARKRAEEALRRRERELQTLTDNTPAILTRFDRAHRHLFVNAAVERATGRRAEEFIGKTNAELGMPPEACARWDEAIAAVIATRQSQTLEFRFDGSGETRHFASLLVPEVGADGEVDAVLAVATDITESKRAREEAELRAAEAEEARRTLHAIMDHVPEGITVADAPDVRIRVVSRYGQELVGRPAENLMGPAEEHHEPWGFCHIDGATLAGPEELPLTRATRNGEVVTNEEWLLRRTDGGRIPILCNAGPIRDGAGRITGGVIVWRDISAWKRTQEELALANRTLREQDRRKDEFLAVLAHELRNPLAPIRNGLSILRLQAARTDGKSARLLDIMDRQLSQMVHLVDDLLDVARVSSGKITLKIERLDLRSVIDATLDASRPMIEAARHQVEVQLPDAPLALEGDRTRLTQVFTNLVANACKYTPEGGRIRIEVERAGSEAVVRVRDTGVGIPAAMLTRVFEMFTQVGKELERAQGGLGIGLSLVKRLVEMHGGVVTAESAGAGEGSTFTVRLPIEPEATQAPREANGPDDQRVGTHRRVLVVDDNRDAAESLAMLLEVEGHETAVADDGPSALALARTFMPDVAVLDIGLPGMSGYDLARAMRRLDRGPKVLIALTGWGSDDDKRKAVEAGFDRHLTKPASVAQLIELFKDF